MSIEKIMKKIRFVKEGGSCFECCDYEGMVKDLRTSLEEYGREVIDKCIEALPKNELPKKKLGRPRKFADSGVKVVKIKLLSVEQIKEILNNLK
jgi:hypothetical protein